MMRQVFALAARLFLGFVFAAAGLIKLTEPIENFQAAVQAFPFIPDFFEPLIAYGLPWIEFLLGASLLLGFMTSWCAMALGGLSLSFLVLLAATVLSGRGPEACGCFGAYVDLTLGQMMVLDAVNVVFGFFLARQFRHRWSLDSLLQR